jgi:predicted Rossmann fold nucleotide-binding protein DprA/Smf involved in DNA uptake
MNGLGDLITALKGRVNDPNKQLCKLFISFTAHLIESAGKDIRIHCKVLILALIEVLADKTEAIRKESVQALTRIGNMLGMDLIINCMGQPLESDKVEFRA